MLRLLRQPRAGSRSLDSPLYPRPGLGPRIWALYALSWAAVLVALAAHLGLWYDSASQGLAIAFQTVAPASMLGILAWCACWRTDWSRAGRRFLVRAHILGATAFVLALPVGIVATFTLDNLLRRGQLQFWAPPVPILAWQLLMGLLFYATLSTSIHLVISGFQLTAERARAERAEALRAKVELGALRAQLNPHFLFNTLHTLSILAENDPELTSEKLDEFGEIFRYSLSVHRREDDRVRLSEEWDFTRKYLALEKLRLGDRLRLKVAIQREALACHVPAFSIQPLVENAIKHAIAPHAGPGLLAVRAQTQGDRLWIEVEDTGPGVARVELERTTGVGLSVLRERLATLYAGKATLEFSTARGEGFLARIELPRQAETRARRQVPA